MGESERSNLEVVVARLEEKLDAVKNRLDRVEGVLVAIGLLLVGGLVTAAYQAI